MKLRRKIGHKIRKMTAKEIILAMVDGLKDPVVPVYMEVFLKIDRNNVNNIKCFGCAATNMICKLGKIDLETVQQMDIMNCISEAFVLKEEEDIISAFESAIDRLRRRDIYGYNIIAKIKGFSEIPEDGFVETIVPYLEDGYTPKELQEWVEFANSL